MGLGLIMEKYYMYDKDSKEYNKWYTTNENLIKEFKLAKKYYKLFEICGCVSIISFFAILISAGLNSWIAGLIFGVLMISSILIGFLVFLEKYDTLFIKTLNKYYETDEYKELYNKYIEEENAKRDALLYEKSKRLVEAYDIIDNKHLSQEERINLLKQYVDKE